MRQALDDLLQRLKFRPINIVGRQITVMQHISDIFSTPKRLNLTGTERTIWLQGLLEFLHENPTHIGRVLMGRPGPWNRKHVRELELLICGLDDRQAIRNYLSILHEAARLWSADTRKRVPLTHFLPHETSLDNPFSDDFAAASLCCENWKQKLAMLISSGRDDKYNVNKYKQTRYIYSLYKSCTDTGIQRLTKKSYTESAQNESNDGGQLWHSSPKKRN
jgi:hypothetical protein